MIILVWKFSTLNHKQILVFVQCIFFQHKHLRQYDKLLHFRWKNHDIQQEYDVLHMGDREYNPHHCHEEEDWQWKNILHILSNWPFLQTLCWDWNEVLHQKYHNNNNNLIFILRKIHVNMIKCALHESQLSTLISYPK